MADLRDDETAQNDLNIKLKALPWYQEFLKAKGQNPNKVKLSDQDRKELQAVAAQNGVVLPEGVNFDPAGNVNERHGFASQPGWAKALEIGGALAPAAIFAAPAIAGAIGGASVPSTTLAASGGIVPGLGTAAKIGKAAMSGVSTLDKIGSLLEPGAKAVDAATTRAYNSRLNEEQLGMQASQQEQGLNQLEQAERARAKQDLYRASVAKNPMSSPFNPVGPQKLSPEMMQGMSELEKQALAQVSQAPKYGTANLTPPRTNIKPPSTMETVGKWLAPGMSMADLITRVF